MLFGDFGICLASSTEIATFSHRTWTPHSGRQRTLRCVEGSADTHPERDSFAIISA